jgi:hypothetical protein
MYSNYSFQFLEISSVFLIYHNGITNISIASDSLFYNLDNSLSIARVGDGFPHIIKILRLTEQL